MGRLKLITMRTLLILLIFPFLCYTQTPYINLSGGMVNITNRTSDDNLTYSIGVGYEFIEAEYTNVEIRGLDFETYKLKGFTPSLINSNTVGLSLMAGAAHIKPSELKGSYQPLAGARGSIKVDNLLQITLPIEFTFDGFNNTVMFYGVGFKLTLVPSKQLNKRFF